ncbi:hypothetical protein J6590_029951 [Homalodisca vitripennis]|nr:hypothetical protein J6590_029951 [Homalodisca vitripennis]
MKMLISPANMKCLTKHSVFTGGVQYEAKEVEYGRLFNCHCPTGRALRAEQTDKRAVAGMRETTVIPRRSAPPPAASSRYHAEDRTRLGYSRFQPASAQDEIHGTSHGPCTTIQHDLAFAEMKFSAKFQVHSKIRFQDIQRTSLQIDNRDILSAWRGVPSRPTSRFTADCRGLLNPRDKALLFREPQIERQVIKHTGKRRINVELLLHNRLRWPDHAHKPGGPGRVIGALDAADAPGPIRECDPRRRPDNRGFVRDIGYKLSNHLTTLIRPLVGKNKPEWTQAGMGLIHEWCRASPGNARSIHLTYILRPGLSIRHYPSELAHTVDITEIKCFLPNKPIVPSRSLVMCDCHPPTCDLCSGVASCAVTTAGLDTKSWKAINHPYPAGDLSFTEGPDVFGDCDLSEKIGSDKDLWPGRRAGGLDHTDACKWRVTDKTSLSRSGNEVAQITALCRSEHKLSPALHQLSQVLLTLMKPILNKTLIMYSQWSVVRCFGFLPQIVYLQYSPCCLHFLRNHQGEQQCPELPASILVSSPPPTPPQKKALNAQCTYVQLSIYLARDHDSRVARRRLAQ